MNKWKVNLLFSFTHFVENHYLKPHSHVSNESYPCSNLHIVTILSSSYSISYFNLVLSCPLSPTHLFTQPPTNRSCHRSLLLAEGVYSYHNPVTTNEIYDEFIECLLFNDVKDAKINWKQSILYVLKLSSIRILDGFLLVPCIGLTGGSAVG